MSRIPRAYHAGVPGPGSDLMLEREEAHHVLRVLRLRKGASLFVFDGRGREWECSVLEAGRKGVLVRVGAECTDAVEPALEVVLYQGLCRPERMEWLIQKAVEVGAAAVHPVLTARSDAARPSPARLERWRRISLEACKQCGRRRVPEVSPAESFPAAPPDTLALVLTAGRDVPPLAAQVREAPRRAVWLAVGPEGGLAEEESEHLARGGWRRAGLGPRTLRTETAGLVACALVLFLRDDLGAAGRPPVV